MKKSWKSFNPINHGSDNYDIIKAHGGEIKAETRKDEGAGLLFNYL